ncbi:hypothetical protein PHYBLDRAFT_66032 [Phycomyces blakesleeanus NRRL 1555(-)]|uniref:Uncharacterized protein n=1 Tax=Phycomyces blakesleeanus (strain ATCC 8743b / DSM 1359 / FGSC 10004 / NBRC 33097 / NRRL 1555) TaxID=763407 RepID=A0A163AH03_PHYB8|nr:hypothetical protein PHYBLDRAFT_66032 [Phycomyces blakesleeanus NRRL 1555(-)]OAD73421.1 hypothetical protein PHYBLDRAFT_66032 [Phycomyces blakesleeanus NRRL 1555(-)]|eukprot:XP_018291461.1 hypothetical protein PHYBLDRAFT_66032 [Phycomyces blakesleeanus NRRL 1555(-)]
MILQPEVHLSTAKKALLGGRRLLVGYYPFLVESDVLIIPNHKFGFAVRNQITISGPKIVTQHVTSRHYIPTGNVVPFPYGTFRVGSSRFTLYNYKRKFLNLCNFHCHVNLAINW